MSRFHPSAVMIRGVCGHARVLGLGAEVGVGFFTDTLATLALVVLDFTLVFFLKNLESIILTLLILNIRAIVT